MHTRHASRLTIAAGICVAVSFIGSKTSAFPGCNNNVGPDVIVGDLQSISNYTNVGDIDAFSVGTYSCNIGNQNLPWVANSNNHPVIPQNMYRYRVVNGVGQFEQIGMSWLKHAFTALTDNICCTCNGQGGAVLGVGCADPYTSGRNGTQLSTTGGLGPRFDINAHSGAYTWPYPFRNNNGSVSVTSITRRVQVKTADLNPTLNPGAKYYVEAMYVTPSDCGLGNQDNNASSRAITISGSDPNYTAALSGSTQREQPAIMFWKTNDPSVTLTEIAAPESDAGGTAHDVTSRIILGHKATDLGGGQWAYEYAMMNLNSDRSVDGFYVPIPAGAVVTSSGFHDIFYHSGDGFNSTPTTQVNFDGTDWPAVVSSTQIAWDMVPASPLGNSNAIRWGTMYNFRFVINAPPETGDITFSQFKVDNTVVVHGVTRPGTDCDGNNVADSVQIAGNPGLDANSNGVLDSCESAPCDA
ncbi:MAG TPA: hypothetical protein VG711_10535, partial [Phycisphaerales bacterium]|nr:hypothetical protein [Phycisphaerales bacterium]